jgi:hypothetical protein
MLRDKGRATRGYKTPHAAMKAPTLGPFEALAWDEIVHRSADESRRRS